MNKQALHLLNLVKLRRSQTDAPNYRAASDPQANCGLCRFFVRSAECDLYKFAADPDYVCDSFEPRQPDMGQLRGELIEPIKAMIEKLGARNSKHDLSMLQQVHDLTSRLGAKCGCD